MHPADPSTPEELAQLDALIHRWATALPEQGLAVAGVERVDDAPRCWYVRMDGEEKTNFSMLLTLEQRTLTFASYFMPAPEENEGELYAHLLTRNARFYGLAFVIGAEGAIYLQGQLDNRAITEAELDRVLGSVYMATEQCFRPAMRIGFARRF